MPEFHEVAGKAGEMSYKEKGFDVWARRMPQFSNKLWVFVRFWGNGNHASWVPSFEDLFRIIQAICHCEDMKYPQGEGRGMVRRFLHDCCEKDADWEKLRTKYKIPERT